MFLKVREIYRKLKTMQTLGKQKLIDCKREPENLRRHLCSSFFSTKITKLRIAKCRKNRFCCNYIPEDKLFKFKKWNQLFICKTSFSCQTPNLYIGNL